MRELSELRNRYLQDPDDKLARKAYITALDRAGVSYRICTKCKKSIFFEEFKTCNSCRAKDNLRLYEAPYKREETRLRNLELSAHIIWAFQEQPVKAVKLVWKSFLWKRKTLVRAYTTLGKKLTKCSKCPKKVLDLYNKKYKTCDVCRIKAVRSKNFGIDAN